MSSGRILVLVGIGLLIAAVVLFWVVPTIEEANVATPIAAWVGVEVEGSGVAVIGKVALEAGTSFRLRAILEARAAGGETLYYSEATAIRFPDRTVSGDQIRP